VRPLLGGDIEFIGEVSGPTKHDLGNALCLLNPMAWPEPFGTVMIEVLASGTPVVATPCGAAPEIVEDGTMGYLRIGGCGCGAACRRHRAGGVPEVRGGRFLAGARGCPDMSRCSSA